MARVTPSEQTPTSTVFVYGSLKRGLHNHGLLGDPTTATFLGRVHLEGKIQLISLGSFPGLIENKTLPRAKVVGEAYRITQDVLQSLDILEGNKLFYTRKKVYLNNKIRAWCYFLPFEEYANRIPKDKTPEQDTQCWAPTEEERAYMLAISADASQTHKPHANANDGPKEASQVMTGGAEAS